MARPVDGEDKDQDFLDRVIALALDVIERSNVIKEISDEPDILKLALEIEGRGLLIQKVTREYRPRIKDLKI